jgi:hypothetical protein
MSTLLRIGLAVASLLCVCACGGSGATPSPSTTTPAVAQARPGASPNAVSIALGQTVSGVVAVSDAVCESHTTDPSEPCQRYAIAIATAGVLRVLVKSPGPSGLTLSVGSLRRWGVTTLSAAAGVEAGSTYEISVGLHDAASASQAFELTTSLDPQ